MKEFLLIHNIPIHFQTARFPGLSKQLHQLNEITNASTQDSNVKQHQRDYSINSVCMISSNKEPQKPLLSIKKSYQNDQNTSVHKMSPNATLDLSRINNNQSFETSGSKQKFHHSLTGSDIKSMQKTPPRS